MEIPVQAIMLSVVAILAGIWIGLVIEYRKTRGR
jgi:uncharacterized protein YneF (UPF0154 family)